MFQSLMMKNPHEKKIPLPKIDRGKLKE